MMNSMLPTNDANKSSDKRDSDSADRDALLAYYRSLADGFESERRELVTKLDEVNINRTDYQKLQYELNKKNEQISELQKALSNAHLYLFDEREHVLKLTSEIDELRIREKEDRKRIQHLLALTQPVSEEVTYFRDKLPRKVSCPYAGDRNNSNNNSNNATNKGTAAGKENPTNVLRTIYLPNESVDSLTAMAESLRTRLAETEKLASERERAYREERRVRDEEAKTDRTTDKEHIHDLELNIELVSKKHRASLKEHLVMRHQFNQEKRALMERLEKLCEQKDSLSRQLQQLQIDSQTKIKENQKRESLKSETLTSQFRKQAMDREEDLSMMKEQYSVAQQLYENKIQVLKKKMQEHRRKYKKLAVRRALEIEGFGNDIRALRERVRDMARMVLSLKVGRRYMPDKHTLVDLQDQLTTLADKLDSYFE